MPTEVFKQENYTIRNELQKINEITIGKKS